MRFFPTTLFASVCVLAASAFASAAPAPAAGGKVVTLPFPAKAQLVVQVHGLERSRERIEKLFAAAAPNEAEGLSKTIDDGLKQLLGERKLTAVPKDGRWFVAARDLGQLGEPETPLAVFIPVTDAKAFRESFLTAEEQKTFQKGDNGIGSLKATVKGNETTVYLVDQPGYVIATPSLMTAEFYAAKYEKATRESLGGDVSKALLDSDVGLYVNMDAVNDQYGQQIQAFRQFIDFAMQQAQGAAGGGVNKKQMDAAKVLFKGLFQGLEDARAFVIGTEFRPEGLALCIHSRFVDDSSTGNLLRNERLTAVPELATLPKGYTTYTAGQFGPAITKVFKDLNQAANAPEDDDKAAEAIKKYSEEIQAAGPEGESQAASLPDLVLIALRYKEPAKAVAAELKMLKALPAGSSIQNVILKDKPTVVEAARKLGSFTFHEVKLTFDFDATVKDIPENLKEATIASMKRMLGEKSSRFLGTDGKVVLNVVATDWDAAKKSVEEYLAGKTKLADVAAFTLTRKNLPADASLLGVMDTGRLIGMLGDYMKNLSQAIPGFPAQIPALKPAKGEPAYVGFAVSLKPETAQIDLFIPASAAQVARKVLAPIFQKIE